MWIANTYSAYYVLYTMLSALYILIHFIPLKPNEGRYYHPYFIEEKKSWGEIAKLLDPSTFS